MMPPPVERTRRAFLHVAGGIVIGLAGCTESDDSTDDENEDENDLSGPVSEDYETATSQDGSERNPEDLYSKSDIDYQSEPRNEERCEDCAFYISDKDGDGLGACTEVEGYIEPEGWCTLYQRYESG